MPSRAVVLLVASQRAAPQYEAEADARLRRIATSFKSPRVSIEAIKTPQTQEGSDSALLSRLRALLLSTMPAVCDRGQIESGLKDVEVQAYGCDNAAPPKQGRSGLAYTQVDKINDIVFVTRDTYLAATAAELAAATQSSKRVHVVFNVTDNTIYGPNSTANLKRARDSGVRVYVLGHRRFRNAATAPVTHIESPSTIARGKDVVVLWDNDSGQRTVQPPKSAWGKRTRASFMDLCLDQ